MIITQLRRSIREMEQNDKTEEYEALVMEVIVFESEDIITESGIDTTIY